MAIRNKVAAGLAVALVASACASVTARQAASSRPTVVATTTLVGDVVKAVGGDAIDLYVLLPIGADPHSFEATPQDVARVAESDVVFVNGAGLEEFLEPLIESAGDQARVVSVSENLPLREFEGEDEHADEYAAGHVEEADPAHEHGVDPHVWFDPANVMIWVDNIQRALSALDAAHAETYAANAAAYAAELEALHAWIAEQVAQIPEENRELVTDHTVFGYFAQRYGFEQVGAIVPGYSTLAEPTAQELASLEDAIGALGVRAIFVGNTVNPGLAERVAADTGTRLVFVYTGSLSEPNGPAGTYIQFMRYNVSALVDALK